MCHVAVGITQNLLIGYLYTISKNDVISSVRKRNCTSGLELGLELAEIRFRLYVFRASIVDPRS